MKKTHEMIYFFTIKDAAAFKAAMLKNIIPLVTSGAQLIAEPSQQPNAILNVAFSATGMKVLGVKDELQDPYFSAGQFVDANALGDAGTSGWHTGFKGATHGLFVLARFVMFCLYSYLHGDLTDTTATSSLISTTFSPSSRAGS
jgi:hypothetical protein